MATLADILRQTGYAQDRTLSTPTPVESPMTKVLADHIAGLPQKTAENIANTNYMVQNAMPYNPQTGQFDTGPTFSEFANYVPNLMGATTWHASPHKFTKFDPTKVGTGEGAQAYGVGAGYVAQNPKIAGEYYKAFTDAESAPLMYKGRRVDTPWNDEITQRWSDVIEKNKFTPEQIEDFQGVLGNLSQVNMMQDVPNVLRGLSKPQQNLYQKYVKPELQKPENLEAHLYKVDVPDEVIPSMLDWDKPLLEQTPAVQEALAKLGIKSDKQKMKAFDDALLDALMNDAKQTLPNQPINPSGQSIYEGMIANNPEITSQKLKESGITGIKYLDAISRKNNPNPTSNYVVFDPQHMNILETYSNPTDIKSILEQEFNKLK